MEIKKYGKMGRDYEENKDYVEVDTFYIKAKSSDPEDVWDAIATYMGTFDTLEDAKKYGLDYNHTCIIKLTTYDGNIESDDDIEVFDFETYDFSDEE